jgi:flagellar biosynthesis protein FliP
VTAPFAVPDVAANPVSLLILLAGMSVLPFLLVAFTSFTKISVVLSLTRSALGRSRRLRRWSSPACRRRCPWW